MYAPLLRHLTEFFKNSVSSFVQLTFNRRHVPVYEAGEHKSQNNVT